MKKIILILTIFSLLSCSEEEQVLYQDSKAFLGFEKSIYNLPVNVNSSSSISVTLVASNVIATNRNYNLSLVPSETDANPATYSFPNTITLPANSNKVTFSVTGTDNNLITSNIKKLVLKLSGLNSNESIDSEKLTINIFEFCPLVISNFVGDFSSNTWWNGPAVNEVVVGSTTGTILINDFFTDDVTNPNFLLSYTSNNNITFTDRNTGFFSASNNGFIWARMSTALPSFIDPCTNKITLVVNYYIPNVGSYGDKVEVFTKI